MSEFETALNEHMDLSDKDTLKKVIAVQEAGHNGQFIVALTSRLYDKIQEKADKVDYSYVEGSRGDITKIPNFDDLCECLDLIKKIAIEYRQKTDPVDIVLTSIENLKARTRLFKKAFQINSQLPVLTYNSLAMSVVESTSLMIATCIDFIKDPKTETFQMALDVVSYNKTRESLMFHTLDNFNKSCVNNEFDKAMGAIMDRTLMKESTNLDEDVLVIKTATVSPEHVPGEEVPQGDLVDQLEKPADDVKPVNSPFLSDEEIKNDTVKVINDEKPVQEKGLIRSFISYGLNKLWMGVMNTCIPIVRNLVYQFQFQRQKAADYYQMQADMLQLNAMNLQYDTSMSESEKRHVLKKQNQLIAKYKQHANNLAIDMSTSAAQAEKLSADEAKKFKADEIDYDEENPDNVYNGSSLF